MKAVAALAIGVLLLGTSSEAQQDGEVVIKIESLNQLVHRLGDPSKSGVYQPGNLMRLPGFQDCTFAGFFDCPGFEGGAGGFRDGSMGIPLVRCRTLGGGIEFIPSGPPVPYQWWITESRFAAAAGSLTFTAKVRYQIGTRWYTIESPAPVPASVSFDSATNLLKVQVSQWKVPLSYDFEGTTLTATNVDVGRFSSFTIRVTPQTATVPLPDGTQRSITGRAQSGTATYEPGRIRVKFDAGFGVPQVSATPWSTGNPVTEGVRLGIGESVLNEMAAAVGTLTFKDTLSFPNPFTFYPFITCSAEADVTGIHFSIQPADIQVTGKVNGRICGVDLPVDGGISTTATITYDGTSRKIRVSTSATSLRPSAGGHAAPFTVNIGSALTLPPLPFGAGAFDVDTLQGSIGFVLAGRNVQLYNRNGYVEVRGDVALR